MKATLAWPRRRPSDSTPSVRTSTCLAGVVLLAAPWHDESRAASLTGVLAALGAAACYAGSYVYARRLLTNRDMEPLVLAAAQLTLGAVLLGSVVPWIGRPPITLSGNVLLSVVALGVLSTGIAYVLNWPAVRRHDGAPTRRTWSGMWPSRPRSAAPTPRRRPMAPPNGPLRTGPGPPRPMAGRRASPLGRHRGPAQPTTDD